jgi:hypothetical protein
MQLDCAIKKKKKKKIQYQEKEIKVTFSSLAHHYNIFMLPPKLEFGQNLKKKIYSFVHVNLNKTRNDSLFRLLSDQSYIEL